MGKKSAKRVAAAAHASPWQDIRMQTLGTVGRRSREQKRFEQATEAAVKNLANRQLPLQELADSVRTCLNNMHGPEWHCMVGRDFRVNVRYWRGKCFIFESSGMKIMAFKSAPPAPETTPTPQTSLDDEDTQADSVSASSARGAGRTSIKVLRSEMGHGYQKRVLKMAAAAVADDGMVGSADDVGSIVSAIKATLTESAGPGWHAVGMKGGGDWGCSVAHEDGQLLDFQLNGNRFVVWKHAQVLRLADSFTSKRISSSLFVMTFMFLCLYIKVQSSCDVCCSSKPSGRWQQQCGESSEECSADARADADRCLRNATVLFYLTCGILTSATAVKWVGRSSLKHKSV